MRSRLQDDSVEIVPRLCFQEFQTPQVEEVSIYRQAAKRSFMMFVRKGRQGIVLGAVRQAGGEGA